MKHRLLKITAVVLVAVLCAAFLVACAPGKPEALKKKLEKKGYDVEIITNSEDLSGFVGTKGLEAELIASKDLRFEDGVVVLFFDTAAHARDAKKEFGDNMSKAQKKDMKESDGKYGVSGKCFYFGSKKAIKDAGL